MNYHEYNYEFNMSWTIWTELLNYIVIMKGVQKQSSDLWIDFIIIHIAIHQSDSNNSRKNVRNTGIP